MALGAIQLPAIRPHQLTWTVSRLVGFYHPLQPSVFTQPKELILMLPSKEG